MAVPPIASAGQLAAAFERARQDLLALANPNGYWVGELASSALATATAVSALSCVRNATGAGKDDAFIPQGVAWLVRHVNADGGWGDTTRSRSNVATTMLVDSAIRLAGLHQAHAALLERASAYVNAQGGVAALERRYGKDRTFAVPILTNAALAGTVAWKDVLPLPFEMACLPASWYRFVGLPVVSYAIPALVAIGQAKYFKSPPWNPVTRLARKLAVRRSLRVLQEMQPASGGYLEAIPLTSFVAMSLAGTGRAEHPVVQASVRFLRSTVRADGSWPIDTDLATWNTTLAIKALATDPDFTPPEGCLPWLLSCQTQTVHPFTKAAPGGWGWSDKSGSVPDADDTPGALLALGIMHDRLAADGGPAPQKTGNRAATGADLLPAVTQGLTWLLSLQNRDGGWPTFCRGWGKLPFDQSGTDLTAHVLRALHRWQRVAPQQISAAMERGLAFLSKRQHPEGYWLPLWFGNQQRPNEVNPVYGTANVLFAYRDLNLLDQPEAQQGLKWLIGQQLPDGGWGGPPNLADAESSVEETALAVEALISAAGDSRLKPAIQRGLSHLVHAVQSNRHLTGSPIGLYFAKLWYDERTYPRVFIVSALGRALAADLGLQ